MNTIVVWILITTSLTFSPPMPTQEECTKLLEIIKYNGTCRPVTIVK